MFENFERLAQDKSSKAWSLMHQCKSISRAMKKAHRDISSVSHNLDSIPSKDTADKLLNGYLRTKESLFRVLHIPSFNEEYESFWAIKDTPGAAIDGVFLLQLKLVMAIGAATLDEKFSLRHLAVQWVNDAAAQLTMPTSKSQLTLKSLKAMVLLCLAREMTGIGPDLIWISIGALIRAAMYMGLHRDPIKLPNMTPFNAEMRRRLWTTILEIAVQSSLDSGGSPLVSLTDFDTQPPGNFDDSQLVPNTPRNECSVAQAPERYTQTSLSIALRETFPARLAIAKFLNDLRSDGAAYQHTLNLDTHLKVAYKQLSKRLSVFSSRLTPFETRIIDFIMRRYFITLHLPFFGQGLQDASYAYSRRVTVEASAKIWQVISGAGDMALLSVCGSGSFRSIPVQACLIIAAELHALLLEDESLGPPTLRPDLLAVLHEAKTWTLQRIEAGETNIKGHLSLCGMVARIDSMVQGLSNDELQQVFAQSVEEAIKNCYTILQGAYQNEQITNVSTWLDDELEFPNMELEFGGMESFFAPSWLLGDVPTALDIW
ncbi:hypothetical protein JX265_011217 [Neoarthrinium moseri]|uniref:Xylanolytic transcriptional activator regulatory domain-containing protein n=1 Tax=Neoarthrinium moseri TaxID=1658444 RepID=A0A9P9WD31_9PEZI|nr:uncharacterized protein JN550_010523 [Neoarthrinium moseri]KAI1845888.1 hypothetical protein JX266_007975 [Neoarthrinium moseri]KAI1857482.1 hypothetical protein JX265_011217 [Neoarthrinium moseri]KAI1862058.1 hypothetical protein JN550_010523 [Neoarthrinium moseri]